MSVNEKNKIKGIFSNLVIQPENETERSSLSSMKSNKSQSSSQHEDCGSASCNPQSKDSFFQRVRTFTTTNWAAKPLELSPLHCAQYGWCNEYQDQLRCVTCNATIYAGIPDEWDSTAYAEICSKIQNELQIGHEQLCPWPKNPCPPSFLSLPSYTNDQWKNVMKEAFGDLVSLKHSLPELNEDEVATMKTLDNSCIERILLNIFKHQTDNDDEALQGKVACILALCGWNVSKPIVEDPSIVCSVCGIEIGLWDYKSISSRSFKRNKAYLNDNISHQSLPEYPDVMSSSISIKSEKSETEKSETEKSENSNHSGSVSHELSKLATSSDSLAQSDLLKPAGSQESLVNLRVSDSKLMAVDNLEQDQEDGHHGSRRDKIIFSEPRLPHATPPELMKELLLSTAPGNHRTHSIYSDSIFSEVGSECFERRLEETNEKDLELDKAVTDNPPASHPNQCQQQWMKELLFMTAEARGSEVTESVISDIGSVSFDKRLDNSSIINSPRSTTPIHRGISLIEEEEPNEHVKTKRMRFQEPDISYFSVLGEHRHWCPWPSYSNSDDSGEEQQRMLQGANNSNASKFSKFVSHQPGWKIVLTKIIPTVSAENTNSVASPPSEAWRAVRSVLGDCVSPAIKKYQ